MSFVGLRKSQIEENNALFTLQPVFREWVTNQLITQVCEEIEIGEFDLFNTHPLLKMQAKVSLVETEIRFILKPIMDRLLNRLKGKSNVEDQLNKILSQWQTKYPQTHGYTASNVRNLLGQLNAVEV